MKNPLCKKYNDEVLPNEKGNCSLCDSPLNEAGECLYKELTCPHCKEPFIKGGIIEMRREFTSNLFYFDYNQQAWLDETDTIDAEVEYYKCGNCVREVDDPEDKIRDLLFNH